MIARHGRSVALMQAMFALRAEHRTGVLDARAGDARTRIHFRAGKAVFVEDAAVGGTLSRLLVRQGILTNTQFVRVLEVMRQTANAHERRCFDEVATELGFLTRSQLESGFGDPLRGAIVRALRRDEPQYAFEDAPDAPTLPESFPVEIESVVLQAIRHFPGPRKMEVLSEALKQFVVLAGTPQRLATRFDMTPQELAFLHKVDGTKTVEGLLTVTDSSDLDVSALLGALVLAGAVVLFPTSSTSSQPVTSEAAQPTAPRPEVSTRQARIDAEQAFQKGTALLAANDLAAGASEFQCAFELQPQSVEYKLYATWAATCRHGEHLSVIERSTLARIAREAARQDRAVAFGFCVLGQLSMWEGDDATAKKHFYETLRRDPACRVAERQVRILARRRVGTLAPVAGQKPIRGDDMREASAPATTVGDGFRPVLSSVEGARPSARTRKLPLAALAPVAFLAIMIVRSREKPQPAGPIKVEPASSAMVPAPAAPPPSSIGYALPSPSPIGYAEPIAPASADALAQPARTVREQEEAGRDHTPCAVHLPRYAEGHRVFVDGRVVESDSECVNIACGPHVIQIGSRGTPRAIDVPCGGEIRLR